MTPEERVKTVLLAPPSTTTVELSRRIGLSHEATRQVRIGQLYPHVLPDLPRQQPNLRRRRCWHCAMARQHTPMKHGESYGENTDPWCSLGYPESIDARYAGECPAFRDLQEVA